MVSIAVDLSAHSVAAKKLNVFHSETARMAKAVETPTVWTTNNGGIGDIQHISDITTLCGILRRSVLAVVIVRTELGLEGNPLKKDGGTRSRLWILGGSDETWRLVVGDSLSPMAFKW